MKIVIVADTPDVRDLIIRLVRKRSEDAELLLADSAAGGLSLALAERPDVLIVDIATGEPATRPSVETILKARAAPAVVLMDEHLSFDRCRRAAAGGAKAYLTRSFSPTLMEAAIGAVIAGGVFFPLPPRDSD